VEQARWSLLQTFGCRRTHERLLEQLADLAITDAEILITGPAWVAKEPYAECAHRRSRRAKAAFVSVNCATIRSQLFDDAFFGRVEEVAPGAQPSEGFVPAAEGGTLFLDDLHALSAPSQLRLLRFIQEKEYRCLGGIRLHRADVVVITASSKDLAALVGTNGFREDLLLRFRVVPIRVPSILKRVCDVFVSAIRDYEKWLR